MFAMILFLVGLLFTVILVAVAFSPPISEKGIRYDFLALNGLVYLAAIVAKYIFG